MKKVHYVTLRVTFDKPTNRANAVKLMRDEFKGGDYYPPQYTDSQPGVMRVTGVKSAKGEHN